MARQPHKPSTTESERIAEQRRKHDQLPDEGQSEPARRSGAPRGIEHEEPPRPGDDEPVGEGDHGLDGFK